jgi:hypothetical protein
MPDPRAPILINRLTIPQTTPVVDGLGGPSDTPNISKTANIAPKPPMTIKGSAISRTSKHPDTALLGDFFSTASCFLMLQVNYSSSASQAGSSLRI